MDKNILAAGGFDVDGAVKRFAGKDTLYFKYLERFPAEPTIGQLEEAVKTNDYEAAYVASHTLKGVAGNLGVTATTEACQTFLGMLKDKDYSNFNTLATDIIENYKKACEVISLAK